MRRQSYREAIKGSRMPVEMERHLREEVNRKHPHWTQEHKDRYVYGGMVNRGWRPTRNSPPRWSHWWWGNQPRGLEWNGSEYRGTSE